MEDKRYELGGKEHVQNSLHRICKGALRWHKLITLEPEDLVFVKLHKRHHPPGLENSKLSNQRVGPSKVLKKWGDLAYKLELPDIWKSIQ